MRIIITNTVKGDWSVKATGHTLAENLCRDEVIAEVACLMLLNKPYYDTLFEEADNGNKPRTNILLYRDLPEIITTNDELYVVFMQAAKTLSPRWRVRMEQKGLTPADVADELFIQYLEKFKFKGKPTKPSIPLFLSINKKTALALIQHDIIDFLSKKTTEEKGNVTLVSLDAIKQ
jgi:hypothetical protein